MSLNLRINFNNTAQQTNSWIEFAMSHDVEKLSMNLVTVGHETYSFPDFFYLSSSLKQLSVRLNFCDMIPPCTVSWKSLRILLMKRCNLPDESIANIFSGCPNLENLALHFCGLLQSLDLSKSPNSTRLEIVRNCRVPGPTEIVAPHIHYLRLKNSDLPCTLVDVSSLTEAKLDICINLCLPLKADFLQNMVLKMLTYFQNVEKITVGPTILQVLSLAELRGVLFPALNVQTLVVKTMIVRSVIPGIARLLQNSPGLKKLIVDVKHYTTILDEHLDSYLVSQGLNPDQCWRSKYEVFPTSRERYLMLDCKDTTSKLLALFMELVLKNAKTLETMLVPLGGIYFDDAKWFEELLQMVHTLSHSTNVSIVLKRG